MIKPTENEARAILIGLIISGIAGIVGAVFIIPAQPAHREPLNSIVWLTGVTGGIIGLLAYFYSYIRTQKRKSNDSRVTA